MTPAMLALLISGSLPPQTGNAGKFLETNGTSTSWQLALPDQTGNAGKFLETNGTDASWVISGSQGALLWALGTSWATLYAQILLTPASQVYVQSDLTGAPRTIPAGTWNLNAILFVGGQPPTSIEFAAGAMLATTANKAVLSTNNLNVLAHAPIVASGVEISLNIVGSLNYDGSTTMLPLVVGQSNINVIASGPSNAIEPIGAGGIVSVADGETLAINTARGVVIFNAPFDGPGDIVFTTDVASSGNIGSSAFGSANVTLTQVNGASIQLRQVEVNIGQGLPVMSSTTLAQGVKPWDGVNPSAIIGNTVNSAATGGITEIVQGYGLTTRFVSDGVAVISIGDQLNWSATIVDHVTPIGSSSDSGVFATIALSAAAATPGAFVFANFLPRGRAKSITRVAQAAITAPTPVMASSTIDLGIQVWDGDDVKQIIGSLITSATDANDNVQVVEQKGENVKWLNDGTTAITRNAILNYSTLVVGRVTTVGAAHDSGDFATVARTAAAATPGAVVQGNF